MRQHKSLPLSQHKGQPVELSVTAHVLEQPNLTLMSLDATLWRTKPSGASRAGYHPEALWVKTG